MTRRDSLPSFDDLPIPRDIVPGKGWTAQMVELADHIGAYATIRIVEAFGGERFRMPKNPDRCPFREVIGDDAAKIVSHVYGGGILTVPVARQAIFHARARDVLADVRAGNTTVADAARILRTSQSFASQLVNHGDTGGAPAPRRRLGRPVDPRQIDMFREIGHNPAE